MPTKIPATLAKPSDDPMTIGASRGHAGVDDLLAEYETMGTSTPDSTERRIAFCSPAEPLRY